MTIKYLSMDMVGAGLSVLCLVHCILTGLLVSVLPVMAGMGHIHYGLLLLLLPVAGIAIYNAACMHNKKGIAALILTGIVFVAFATLFLHDLLMEVPVMIAGSLMLVYGHYLNHRACRACLKEHGAG